jgi:hypothetical protein
MGWCKEKRVLWVIQKWVYIEMFLRAGFTLSRRLNSMTYDDMIIIVKTTLKLPALWRYGQVINAATLDLQIGCTCVKRRIAC